MAKGKFIALTTLDMGNYFIKPGGEVELADEIAKVLLRKRVIKSVPRPVKKRERKPVPERDRPGPENGK